MPKATLTREQQSELRKISDRTAEIRNEFQDMHDVIEKEKRGLTPEEDEKKKALIIEREQLELRAAKIESGWIEPRAEQNKREAFSKIVRALCNGNQVPEEYKYLGVPNQSSAMAIPLNERSVQDTASVDPLVPLTIGDIILPLEKGLILNKVGCKIQTGMVGTWNFPVVAGVEATIEDENAEISDSVIDISKISPSPKRCALKIPVSNRAINQSSNAILDIVNTQIAAGLQRLLNKWMFSPTLVTGASNGCFVKDAPTYVAGSSFTYKDAIKLQGIVLATGVQMDGTAAYVCSASTLADLKSTPIASGSGLMIVQDGKIDGYPVFVTEYIGDGKLGFGIFNYEMVGQFGPMMLIVDRITGAAKNLTYFILNVDFDMLSLRTEAFGVAQTATIPAIGVNKTSIATSAAAAATITEEVSVSGINLTAAIAAAITGTNSALFTVAPATIAKNSDGSAFAKLVITYAPTAVGSHSATLALSTTGGTTVNIALAGTCA